MEIEIEAQQEYPRFENSRLLIWPNWLLFYSLVQTLESLSLALAQISWQTTESLKKHWKSLKVGTGFGGKNEVGLKIEDLIKRIKD